MPPPVQIKTLYIYKKKKKNNLDLQLIPYIKINSGPLPTF